MANTNDTSEGWDLIDQIYEASAEGFGKPIELRLFDVQLCESLQIDWLAGAVLPAGIDRETLDALIHDQLVRCWVDAKGQKGYILYSEHLVQVVHKLRCANRYTLDELQHIVGDWHSYLEIVTTDELAYDDMDVDDYEHFKRRASEMVCFFQEDIDSSYDSRFAVSAEQWLFRQDEARQKLKLWNWINDQVQSNSDDQLSSEVRKVWRKQLFQLRWADEWARMMTAQQFSTQIEEGYGPEISFDGHTWQDGVMTLRNLNWHLTLRRLKETRNEGKAFPLRTPDFNVTERGIEYLKPMTPGEYQTMYERYHVDRLHALLKSEGPALWVCDLAASGRALCEECGEIFERTTASRRFCKDRCRNRNKGRRWRKDNPELSRIAQANYYRTAYPENMAPKLPLVSDEDKENDRAD